MLEIKPVRKYKTPAYPTKKDALNNRRLLYENQPPLWRYTPQLAGIAAFLITANACTNFKPSHEYPIPDVAIVAPLFNHGEGRGAWGCVVVSPPSYLTEDEAIQVIVEELQKGGVYPLRKNVKFPEIKLPRRELHYYKENGEYKEDVHEIPNVEPLNLDLVDDKKHIGIEYISIDDYVVMGGVSSSSTVQGFNFPDVVQVVSETINEQSKESMYYGIFYDPLVKWKDVNNHNSEEAKQLLREQIKDFLDWLYAQGVP